MNHEFVLQATGLTKSFADLKVLRGVDLCVRHGQIYGLLGSNGAGKTTAINIMTGLLPSDAGLVEINGVADNLDRLGMIGVAPQEIALYPRLTSAENIAFFGGLFGMRGAALRDRMSTVIEEARLADYRDVRVSTLSGGTRRRLNLAVAMVHEPDLLILDEPTAGLDIEARYALWAVIGGLRDAGISVLLTTHLLDEAAALCDRIALLHEGRIAREGTLETLCATVPAAQIAETESDDESVLRARAAACGFAIRQQGRRLALLLPETTSLESLVEQLRGTAIRSIALRPVTLEDVFFDVTKDLPRA